MVTRENVHGLNPYDPAVFLQVGPCIVTNVLQLKARFTYLYSSRLGEQHQSVSHNLVIREVDVRGRCNEVYFAFPKLIGWYCEDCQSFGFITDADQNVLQQSITEYFYSDGGEPTEDIVWSATIPRF